MSTSMFPKKPTPILHKDVKYDAIGDEENDDNVELSSMNKARTSLISPRNRKSGTRICLNDIPKDLAAKLRHLDLEDDGFIDVEDIMVLDQKEQIEEDTVDIINQNLIFYIHSLVLNKLI